MNYEYVMEWQVHNGEWHEMVISESMLDPYKDMIREKVSSPKQSWLHGYIRRRQIGEWESIYEL